jgi:outer membrane protein TolC
MRKDRWKKLVTWMLAGSMFTGCMGSDKRLRYLGDADLSYYKDYATAIEYPCVDEPTSDKVSGAVKPRTIRDRSHDEIWDLSLNEAIHTSLANNKIVRTRSDFLSPGSQIFSNPDGVQSVYDPAIRESGVLFGNRGVESALAAFDTQWTTRMLWSGDEKVSNGNFGVGPLGEQVTDQADFSTQLQKVTAFGATMSVAHAWQYTQSNSFFRTFPSAYDGAVNFDYRHPLWAGAGTEFTRIAGPVGTNIAGVSGVNQGVLIARINTDISIVDFEAQVRNMVKDVEDVYWDLYLAYRTYDSEIVARNSALQTWREVKAKSDIGGAGGGAADEAQSREAYFDARSRAENSLQSLYNTEIQLRRLIGLSVNDGRVIRPADEPVTAEFVPVWYVCLAESMTRREELRRQKWNIKSLELQLVAAENLTNPRLDFTYNYHLNGFGDRLYSRSADNSGAPFNSAYTALLRSQQTGWNTGFEFSMPLGFRNAHAQVRNVELRMAKAREVLAVQELEISHELANAFQNLDSGYVIAQTNFNRRRAAERQLQAFDAEYKTGRKTLDLLLQAQTRLANSEIAYYRSLIQYNKSITDIHYRKGSLLEFNNVHLSEGEWSPNAYNDALRRSWARSHAWDADHKEQQPGAFVTGEDYSSVHLDSGVGGAPMYDSPTSGQPGVQVPTPVIDPTPVAPPK